MRSFLTRPRALVAAAAVITAGSAIGAVAIAAPPDPAPSGVHITPLAQAGLGGKVLANSQGIAIRTKGPRAMLVTKIVVDPGGTFGWHTHPGPVLVALAQGTLTVFEAHQGHCMRSTVKAGDAFIEDGGHDHLARNQGTKPVQLYATFLARTGTTEFLQGAARPRACGG
jgi:quercetin dioxygenase-like cupin family protein